MRAYCWVSVEAPCRCPPLTLAQAARSTPLKSMPRLVQKVRSSAATIACLAESFIWSYGTMVRFCAPSFAIGVRPSA